MFQSPFENVTLGYRYQQGPNLSFWRMISVWAIMMLIGYLIAKATLTELYTAKLHLDDADRIDFNAYTDVKPRLGTDSSCNEYYLDLINDFFHQTSIKPADKTDVEYCHKRQNDDVPKIDLKEVINLYKSFKTVESYTNAQAANPVIAYGEIKVDDGGRLPLFVVADIRKSHLPPTGPIPAFGTDVDRQMELMGQLHTDDRGFLLAYNLGGDATTLNLFPLAKNVGKNITSTAKELGLPNSSWKSNEDWIRRFLVAYPYGRVVWNMALQYPGDTTINPKSETFRPASFALQFTAYTEQDDTNSVYYTSPQLSFLNSNEQTCGGEITPRVHDMTGVAKCPVNYFQSPVGQMGEEMSNGKWKSGHQVAFSYSIGGKHYIFAHNTKDGTWFVQELLAFGQMGEQKSNGTWSEGYSAIFPYTINGRQFFYAHDISHLKWFVQELLPNGRLGSEYSRGAWRYGHANGFPYTIGGRLFYYTQNMNIKNWGLTELLPNGQMGAETQYQFWDEGYPIVFPFKIGGRQFFYAHNPATLKWFIQELLPNGKMGSERSRGLWTTKYHVSFPFTVGGKHFFYGQNTDTGYSSIHELLPDGKMGEEKSHGNWGEGYSVVAPFTINDRQYFYGHNPDAKFWFVQKLI